MTDLREQLSDAEGSDDVLAFSPRDDPYGQLLHDREFFVGYLGLLVERFRDKFGLPVLLGQPTHFEGLARLEEARFASYRFLIVPIFSFDINILVIIDFEKKEFGIMNPNSAVILDTIKYVKESLKHFSGYKSVRMNLTIGFHRRFPLAHLLAGVITFEHALEYAVMLPRNLIYQECSFRNMCTTICKRQEVVNQRKNLDEGLIDSGGRLRPGAYRTFSSPVQIEDYPVKTDMCFFCTKRRSKNRGANLGVHMKMKHGGLARELRGRQLSWNSCL